MSVVYCLAKSVVLGEIVIQGSSVTYSATASAFEHATSAKDAKNLAIIASNTAAIAAARMTVDEILAKYAYVLSDTNITNMINNNLSTVTRVLRPLALSDFAYTNDGIRFFLKSKFTKIPANRHVRIENGLTLVIGPDETFLNSGLVQLGGQGLLDNNQSLSVFQAPATLVWTIGCKFGGTNASNNTYKGIIIVGTAANSTTASLIINTTQPYTTPCPDDLKGNPVPRPKYNNAGTITIYVGGVMTITNVDYKNILINNQTPSTNNFGGIFQSSLY